MYIQLVSIHGLIRSENVEMGRDADTGGQVRYVLELLNALSQSEQVEQIDLFTRRIGDKRVSSDYSKQIEKVNEKARIVRLPCGGGKYIRKERLWPLLDEYIDRMIAFTLQEKRMPAVIHGHYADAGYIARHVASIFGVPFVFSGHSLGRNKKAFLVEEGWSPEKIDQTYNMEHRIEEEERIAAEADQIICSTHYERDALWGRYENSPVPQFKILPPGIGLERFFPYYDYEIKPDSVPDPFKQARMRMLKELQRFHFDPDKPLILAVSRPEKRKNISMLVEAYGQDKELQALANLAIFAGVRKNIVQMNDDEQQVLTDMLLLMDRYDLYGKMAIPKRHSSETDVPELYRIAASKRGVFVSPSFLETFGLTFIEASSTGLPFVCSNHGGPRDIVANCDNGVMVDLEKSHALNKALKQVLADETLWEKLSCNGINKVREHYSWETHCANYLKALSEVAASRGKASVSVFRDQTPPGIKFSSARNLLISDIDDTLLGDPEGMERLRRTLEEHGDQVRLGVATGRTIESAREVLKENGFENIDLFITSVGTEIYYGTQLVPDKGWMSHLRNRWNPERIRDALGEFPFLKPQEDPGAQREFKISYYLSDDIPAKEALPRIHDALTHAHLAYNLIFSHGAFVDVLPYRAGKGKAIRYFSAKWNLPLNRIVTAGNSGNDRDMLIGNTRAIVVGNREAELDKLRSSNQVFFADGFYANGVLEGLAHYKVVKPSPQQSMAHT